MDFLSDRLDKTLFDDPDELAFIQAHVGFGKLTLKEARAALAKAKQVEESDDVDLSGVIDELEEIVDDLEFTKDPKNSIIIWVNDNHRRTRGEGARAVCDRRADDPGPRRSGVPDDRRQGEGGRSTESNGWSSNCPAIARRAWSRWTP